MLILHSYKEKVKQIYTKLIVNVMQMVYYITENIILYLQEENDAKR